MLLRKHGKAEPRLLLAAAAVAGGRGSVGAPSTDFDSATAQQHEAERGFASPKLIRFGGDVKLLQKTGSPEFERKVNPRRGGRGFPTGARRRTRRRRQCDCNGPRSTRRSRGCRLDRTMRSRGCAQAREGGAEAAAAVAGGRGFPTRRRSTPASTVRLQRAAQHEAEPRLQAT